MRGTKNILTIAGLVVVVLAAAGGIYAVKSADAAREKQAAETSAVATAAGPSIAIVDIQRLMSESVAAKSIQSQIVSKREGFQKEFEKIEADLRGEEKKIVEAKAKMSAEEFNKKRVEFEKQLGDARKLVQTRRDSLEKSAAGAIGELRLNITKIVAEMAADKNYQLVLTRQNVVLAEQAMDITDEVLTKLDSSLKEVKLKAAEAAPAADKKS